jgi:hypothetical protein
VLGLGGKSMESAPSPQHGQPATPTTHLSEAMRAHGVNQVERTYPVAGKRELEGEEHVEEIFG